MNIPNGAKGAMPPGIGVIRPPVRRLTSSSLSASADLEPKRPAPTTVLAPAMDPRKARREAPEPGMSILFILPPHNRIKLSGVRKNGNEKLPNCLLIAEACQASCVAAPSGLWPLALVNAPKLFLQIHVRHVFDLPSQEPLAQPAKFLH